MADLTLAALTRQTTPSGAAGLFGLFAGVCAIFAAAVMFGDWQEQAAQARWPVAPAVIERAEVVATVRAPRHGGTVWNLRARVRLEADGETRAMTLTSRTAFSEAEASKLQGFAAQHRKGSHIEVRYDPVQKNRGAFASSELAATAGRIHTDFVLFGIATMACAALLALARILSRREASAAPPHGRERGGLALGLVVAAFGLMQAGFAGYAAMQADPFGLDNLMGVPAGLMFVFAGMLIGLPERYADWRRLLAALLISCFALLLDWVAFGPGERRFSGSIGGFGFIPGETLGRAVFGLFAIILDIGAVAMWTGWGRQWSGSPVDFGQPSRRGGLAEIGDRTKVE